MSGVANTAFEGRNKWEWWAQPTATPDVQKLNRLQGARIIAADEKYLGTISKNKFDPDSIANEFGHYGNKFSPDSIFNEFGQYGSRYSLLSPFNPHSMNPPRIVRDGRLLAYLSANKFQANPDYIDPEELAFWVKQG